MCVDADNRNDETKCEYKTIDEGLMEFDQGNHRVLLADKVPAQSTNPESKVGQDTKNEARTHTNATTNTIGVNEMAAPTVNETTAPTASPRFQLTRPFRQPQWLTRLKLVENVEPILRMKLLELLPFMESVMSLGTNPTLKLNLFHRPEQLGIRYADIS